MNTVGANFTPRRMNTVGANFTPRRENPFQNFPQRCKKLQRHE
jgi:hypothetical protein